MRKQDIAARLARKTRLSRAAAADRLDRLIHDILAELKKGNSVPLPGFGKFTPGKPVGFQFEAQQTSRGARGERKR